MFRKPEKWFHSWSYHPWVLSCYQFYSKNLKNYNEISKFYLKFQKIKKINKMTFTFHKKATLNHSSAVKKKNFDNIWVLTVIDSSMSKILLSCAPQIEIQKKKKNVLETLKNFYINFTMTCFCYTVDKFLPNFPIHYKKSGHVIDLKFWLCLLFLTLNTIRWFS